MADHDPSTQPPAEPSGSAEARLAALQRLENGEATKQSQMKWVDGGLAGFVLPILFGVLVDLTGIRSTC
ncbi:hypothetical protein, partial [Ralstonia pseudosolanacearum]|uniref:hypothetical protein n=1 Tax=Ralstonia pseudosolanacearum TaxID=1310165 RepID=UPI003CFB4D07